MTKQRMAIVSVPWAAAILAVGVLCVGPAVLAAAAPSAGPGALAGPAATSAISGKAPAPAAKPADDDNQHVWKSHATSVAVFKNGLGFFLREGEVTLRDGWCLAREVPPAAFGTFAVFSHSPAEVVDVVGSGPGETVEFDGTDAPKDEAAKRARLEASRLLTVQLTYAQKGADRVASGKLVSVGPEYVVLENDSNSFAVPIEGIKKMQVLELPVRVHVLGQADKPPEKAKLGMAYLRKGITWIPEYSLKVIDEETAELTLRGTLVNEAEDLVHCDVNFVVGVPHFVHTEYMAPIAVGQIIRTIGTAVAPKEIQTQIMNRAAIASNTILMDQFDRGPGVVDRPVGAAGDVKGVLGSLPQMESAGATDYTVYTKKNLTVRRGEKAIVTLFTKKIKYTHLYRWSPPNQMEHYLVLANATDTAWTTGPLLATSGDSPLSEDLLKYTPKGGKGEIPVTAAINIAHDSQEKEADRKLRAYEPARDFWVDLVTVEGELKVRNFEKRTADIIVTAHIPGKPLAASDQGAISVDTTKLQLLERTGSVRWTLRIEPGETKTVTYKYERYVPSK